MSENDESEKEYEPTQHKLDEARKRGELIKSQDLITAGAYGGFVLVAFSLGETLLLRLGEVLMAMIDRADVTAQQALGGGVVVMGQILLTMLIAIIPWFLGPIALVILVLFAQRAIVFAPEKIQPKFNRIDPIANAKNKFGRSGLFEFVKSFVKLMLISGVLGWFLYSRVHILLQIQMMEPGPAMALMMRILIDFVVLVLLITAVLGAVDYLWQRYDFMQKNKMTRKEMMDEMKSSEGDPQLKAQRRRKAVEVATRQMIADVAKADVIIVNPTHYAVALKWEKAKKRAPVCVAKGVDEIAARIREVAMENGVPIHPDPPMARTLHATLDIGEEIHPEHYRAVAAAIRFAEKMRVRAGKPRIYS